MTIARLVSCFVCGQFHWQVKRRGCEE
ncbi:hypothetical protein ALC57_18832 [Trachymyrmex cornetzi]|uniref:Uncharacterized protein n=1 Tax=Trachymyrmex cornetzi TaxID=471704 RepID=A0A195D7L5_9HYME|nr:hypothetical protein ALC57_18832 [Trachymyrmex cornetzi]